MTPTLTWYSQVESTYCSCGTTSTTGVVSMRAGSTLNCLRYDRVWA